MSFWSSLSSAISAGIKALGAQLAQFAATIKPVVVAEAEVVGQAALAAVMAEAPKLISGQEKLASAVTNVQASLTATGKTASLTVIQAAVQDAHDQLAQAIHAPTP